MKFGKEYVGFLKQTVQGFVKEMPLVHSAALAYYTLLAFVPLMYLSITFFGRAVGKEGFLEILESTLADYVGLTDLSGFMVLMEQIDVSNASFTLQLSGFLMLLFSVTAILNALKMSINRFYGLEDSHLKTKQRLLRNLLFRLLYLAFILGFTVLIVLIYFAQTVFMSFSDRFIEDRELVHWIFYEFSRHGLPILTNFIVMSMVLKYLHDGYIRWRIVIKGALVTGILLYFGQLLIKYYLSTYFFASGAGMAGSILILMVWVYYSAIILFFGAKLTASFAIYSGHPIVFRPSKIN